MTRSVFVYAVLTSLALIGAYVSWTHEPDVSADKGVTIAPFAADKLTSVVFEDEDQKVVLEPREDAIGEYVWLTWEESEKVKEGKEGESEKVKEGKEGESERGKEVESEKVKEGKEVESGAFKASETAEKIVAKMAPLRAVRKLETEAKLEEFGLKEPKAKLSLKLGDGESYVLDVGNRTYGGQHYYVRDSRSGDIYLMETGQISPLEAPSRLKDRDLHGLERRSIARVEIERGEDSVVLTHHNKSDRAAAFWALRQPGAGDAKKRSEVAETWLDKFFGLYPKDHVAELPEGAKSVFSAHIVPDGDKARTIEVFRVDGDEDGSERFFARSDYARGMVELSTRTASNVVDDLSTLFGGEDTAAKVTKAGAENGAGG